MNATARRVRRAAGVALALLAVSSGAATGQESAPPTSRVDPASWTAVDPATGETVAVLGEGTLHHLVFFATWCPPCRDELPYLADLVARWEDEGYRLVLVAVPTRQDVERLRAFVADRSPRARVLLDATGSVGRALEIDEIPSHVLLDAGGRELYRGPTLAEGVAERVDGEMRARR